MLTMSKERRPKQILNWPKTLRELRFKLGDISQTEAAVRLRVTQRAWSAWETGEKVPSPAMQLLIQLVFQDHL